LRGKRWARSVMTVSLPRWATKFFRRYIYFVRDLPAGFVIGPKDIRRIRPGMGLAPKYFDELLGKLLKVSVKRGTTTS